MEGSSRSAKPVKMFRMSQGTGQRNAAKSVASDENNRIKTAIAPACDSASDF